MAAAGGGGLGAAAVTDGREIEVEVDVEGVAVAAAGAGGQKRLGEEVENALDAEFVGGDVADVVVVVVVVAVVSGRFFACNCSDKEKILRTEKPLANLERTAEY